MSPLFKRKLGPNELSYFLPSRADGVNDMYLHIGFTAPLALVSPKVVLSIWALLRIRHPLLASKIEFIDYEDVSFVYEPPVSPSDALDRARAACSIVAVSKDELISSYLNGDRTLGPDHVSHLFLSSPQASQGSEPLPAVGRPLNQHYDILLATTHYLGDGMALHNCANEFFSLLASTSDAANPPIDILLENEWRVRCTPEVFETCSMLPRSVEGQLPSKGGKFRQAIAKAEFHSQQRKLIGGHAFPRLPTRSPRHTIVPTLSYSTDQTTRILKACKAHGVSISNAIFSLCGVVWSQMDYKKGKLAKPEYPIMMYSALNLRPYLDPKSHELDDDRVADHRREHDSYWFLAIGYFNVILPSFLPNGANSDIHKTFWARATAVKRQTTKAAKSPFVVCRSHIMADERRNRAVAWAKEDDAKLAGTWKLPSKSESDAPKLDASAPSQALIGLSLLGNLDGIYKHSVYIAGGIQLEALTTGSRQRPGAMLLFCYTFLGKLWLSLGYDVNGFDDICVTSFWQHMQEGVLRFFDL